MQRFGSGTTVTITLVRDRPDVNFETGLMLAVGEWSKLGSLDGFVLSADTVKILEQFDLGRFVEELDFLANSLRSARENAAEENAAAH